MMSVTLLGIDGGTISMNAALFGGHGKAVASALEEYRLITPAPDRYCTVMKLRRGCQECMRGLPSMAAE